MGRLEGMGFEASRGRYQRGQASVEFLAAMPVLLVVGMIGWQFAIAGHAWWRVNESARTAARSVYVAEQRGEPIAGRAAARRVARALLGAEARVAVSEGAVLVKSRVPLVWPFSAVGERSAPWLSAAARFGG